MSLRRFGQGGPHVVLLHGIPGSGQSWTGVAEQLAARSRVIVPDLIGFGASARSDDIHVLHAAGQATVLEEVLGHLGVERAVLVGHDFGGPVALTLARRRPELVSGLVLLATNVFADTPIPLPLSAATWPGVGGPMSRILFSPPSLRLMIHQGMGTPRPVADHRLAIGDAGQQQAIRVIFGASLTRMAELYGPIQEGLGDIDAPTLVGWGGSDPFFSVEQGRRTAEAIRGASFRLYEAAGHFLPEERPEEVAADVAELVGLTAARP